MMSGLELRGEVAIPPTNYTLSPNVQIHWLADGDHSFKPRKASGRSLDENLVEAMGAVADFTGSV